MVSSEGLTRAEQWGVHDRVDEAIEDDEEPNRHSLILGSTKHRDHGTGVMIGLEERTLLALCQDDDGIDDLVVLREIE